MGCLSGWRFLTSYEDATAMYLSISLQSPLEGTAAVYYDVGTGFHAQQVAAVHIAGDNQVHRYLFRLPNAPLYNLRLDPPPASQDPLLLFSLDILDGSLRLARRLDLRQLTPRNQIQTLELSDNKADIRIQEGANDPQVNIGFSSPIEATKRHALLVLTKDILLECTGLWIAFCLLASLWLRLQNKVLATVLLSAVLLFGWRCWTLYDDAQALFLRVNMRSSISSAAQVYYDLQGFGFNEKHSASVTTTSGERFRNYAFKLPNKPIYALRFDPLTTGGTVRIGEIHITNLFGEVIRKMEGREITPRNQIRSIHAYDDGLEATAAEEANDPQLSLPLASPLNLEGALPFPLGRWLLALLIEGLAICFVALVGIRLWGKWGRLFLEGLASPFVQETLPLLYLGTALGMILAMGIVSGTDVHPDEWGGHMKAAMYYIHRWLPAAADDPRIVASISAYGVSSLWQADPLYLFAAKASQLFSGIVSDFYVRLRLFNAFLFLSLFMIVVKQTREGKWLVPLFVITPQLWYVFSYFNNDAFPWLIATLLAMQILDPKSSLHRFLSSPAVFHRPGGGILAGLLIGLLLAAKINYRLYVVFVIFLGVWGTLFEASAPERRLRLKKGICIGSLALLFYLPWYGYDQYVNDFKKDEKVRSAMERHADPRFKPSAMRDDASLYYKGLRLKERGVSFQKLFLSDSAWRDLSFKSFFGTYGYMSFFSDSDFYSAVSSALCVFLLLVFFCAAFTLTGRDLLFILLVAGFMSLAVVQSACHSWIHDYQPQGRYLFPLLPMSLVGLARLPVSFRTRILPLFGMGFFLLSVWSFLFTGLMMIPKLP